jgi:pyroglutamyl-peptidase
VRGVKKKFLVTGFQSFGDHQENPSEKLVNALSQLYSSNSNWFSAILPVETQKISALLSDLMSHAQPDVILHYGLAAERNFISFESQAVNLLDFMIPDNQGVMKKGEKILRGGRNVYRSGLPLAELVAELKKNEIQSEISDDAGAYLCNQTLYTSLSLIQERGLRCKAGFIHLPKLNNNSAREYEESLSEQVKAAKLIMGYLS